MLVRAVPGHDDLVPEGAWPANYISYGSAQGFTSSPCD